MRIRIVRRPPGEAPSEIRDAWIGTTLDVVEARTGTQRFSTIGALSMPRDTSQALTPAALASASTCAGYAVYADAALAQLEKRSPEAARWWRENVPYLLTPGSRLIFADSACEVEEAKPSSTSLERTRE